MMKTAVATVLLALASAPAQQPQESPEARQVHWQRSLDDALALCKATGRPLLLAVNMDGESASDRIVHEEYVDPAFVALTRHCVCLGASVFRHNARDYDDEGRRIPCPRFGGITCGEHMALEPQLWDKYLSDGERVAPRHALVLANGKKAFDLSLCFDLLDIDRALDAAITEVAPLDLSVPATADWPTLAARRDCVGRAALEAAIANVRGHDARTLQAALAAIAQNGDAGSLDALRLVAARLPADNAVIDGMLRAAEHADKGAPLALLHEVAQRLTGIPEPSADPRQRAAIQWLPSRHGDTPGDDAYLLVCVAVGSSDSEILFEHESDLASERRGSLAEPVAHHGGAVQLDRLLQIANMVTARERALPLAGGPTDVMPEATELERTLDELDQTPKAQRADAAWCARFAKASLDLARRRMESGGKDAQLLLDDAESFFAKALARKDDRYEWWIERARTAYFRQQFANETEYGMRAWTIAAGERERPTETALFAHPALSDGRAIEALRWVADGCARQLGAQSEPKRDWSTGTMIDALRAFGIVAVSPFGRDADWISFASFCGSLGLRREAAAIAHCGALRYPTSRDLRQELNDALWRCGRPELSPIVADELARTHPSADAAWHAAYAHILAAEDARRREVPRLAIAHYLTAEGDIDAAQLLNAEYSASCNQLRALARMGKALAWAQDGSRTDPEYLAAAVAAQPDLSTVRDGLGMDVFDVVDRMLEWRATGPSVVDPAKLLAAIDLSAPDSPFYAAAISDSLLREALRADGRNPERRPRRTVDAAGNPIVMPMGLPNAEGDRYLLASIEIGRIAAARARTRDDKLPLAQSLTIQAERGYERGDPKGVREALAEAAPLLDLPPPAADADDAALRELMAKLRGLLGEARPRQRDGR